MLYLKNIYIKNFHIEELLYQISQNHFSKNTFLSGLTTDYFNKGSM